MSDKSYSEQVLHNSQVFLNSSNEFISTRCKIERHFSDEAQTKCNWVYADTGMCISDGRQVCELSLYSNDPEEREKSIAKLERLIMELEQLKAAMVYLDQVLPELEKAAEQVRVEDSQVVEAIEE